MNVNKKLKSLIITLFLLLTAYCLLPTPYSLLPVLAQEDTDFDRINNIAKDLNCPTCTGINLSDCRTLTCEQWREQIGELVDEGYSEQQVLDYFSTRYGDQVLLEPPRRGFSLLIWILPVVALLSGGIWLALLLRKWRQEPEGAPGESGAASGGSKASTAAPINDDYLSQVEQDLGIDEAS
jgi:cytochrome c-type biogenesis protein CcmH